MGRRQPKNNPNLTLTNYAGGGMTREELLAIAHRAIFTQGRKIDNAQTPEERAFLERGLELAKLAYKAIKDILSDESPEMEQEVLRNLRSAIVGALMGLEREGRITQTMSGTNMTSHELMEVYNFVFSMLHDLQNQYTGLGIIGKNGEDLDSVLSNMIGKLEEWQSVSEKAGLIGYPAGTRQSTS